MLGAEDEYTLSIRNNLARWTGQAGDAAGARDQLAALLPVRERVLGPEHPVTLTARSNLAFWTGRAGDAAGAGDRGAALDPMVVRPEDTYRRVGRNAPCPCGSGRKYKRCHGDPRMRDAPG